MDCFLCKNVFDQGTVCHSCRQHFRPFLNEEGLEPLHDCPNCDEYSFPCLNCASYTYIGLGEGDLEEEDFTDFVSDKPMSPHNYVCILKSLPVALNPPH